jgi:hypothetical protein
MEQLKNLNLNGKLSENDLQNLLKGLEGSLNNKKKKCGMTSQEKNALLSKLTSSQNDNDTSKEINPNMTEDEKKKHREELRKKLNNKTNMMRNNRSAKVIQTKIYEDKINNVTQNINISGLTTQQEGTQQEVTQQEVTQQEVTQQEVTQQDGTQQEELDDFIN